MPSAKITPIPMVEIIYRVQDIPESTSFNVSIGRIRVNSNAESDDELAIGSSVQNFAARVVKSLRCLCGHAMVAAT